MDEVFARVSKAGSVVCGRPHVDGGYYCDEPLAGVRKVLSQPGLPDRVLVPLAGWRPDRKGIWRQTTSDADRRAHGRPASRPAEPARLELPVLACCPKCAAVQWLDAERLKVLAGHLNPAPAPSRWAMRAADAAAGREDGEQFSGPHRPVARGMPR